jgi:hypothetical protein
LSDDQGQFAGFDLVVDGVLQDGVTLVKSGGNQDALLETGETWTYTVTKNVVLNPGDNLINTATVSATDDDGSSVSDFDTAEVVAAVEGPGVRTPGFWGNLGLAWWDGITGNEGPKANLPNFADGELTYTIDLDGNDATPEVEGLLIGDYNKNGEIDTGEDVFFISLDDAHKVIDASQKVLQDGRYVLERDMIATWLNFLAGNPIGEASDPLSPHHFLDEGIDWMQYTNGPSTATFGDWGGGPAVKTSSATWQAPVNDTSAANNDTTVAAAVIHEELDTYNNTGSTFYIDANNVKQFVMYASDGG